MKRYINREGESRLAELFAQNWEELNERKSPLSTAKKYPSRVLAASEYEIDETHTYPRAFPGRRFLRKAALG